MNETKETSKKILNKDFEIEEKNRTIELLEKALVIIFRFGTFLDRVKI
jgi:hypothetical protein